MPSVCAIALCKNRRVNQFSGNVIFHSFPKDPLIRKIWQERCLRADGFDPAKNRICSLHFQESDYERDLQAELLNKAPKRILKKNAIPSLYFNSEPQNKTNVEANIKEEIIDKFLSETGSNSHNIEIEWECLPTNLSTPILITTNISLEEKYEALLKHHNTLNMNLKIENQLNKKLSKHNAGLTNNLVSLNKKLKRLEREVYNFKILLNQTFSKAQLQMLLKDKKKVQWSRDDLLKAYRLKCLSNRCYMYLRDELNYPLPHEATLRKWYSKRKLIKPTKFEFYSCGNSGENEEEY